MKKLPPWNESELPIQFTLVLKRFLQHLDCKASLSLDTKAAYEGDIRRFLSILNTDNVTALNSVTDDQLQQIISQLSTFFDPATIARNLSSLRRFYRFLHLEGLCTSNPTKKLRSPKIQTGTPEILSIAEVGRLLRAATGDNPLDLRNRAILELLYACGLRVTEIIAFDHSWLQIESELMRVPSKNKAKRIIPIGQNAISALQRYISNGRHKLISDSTCRYFFLNSKGEALSRMGVWKIVRNAADNAGLKKRVGPSTLRHSFAKHLVDGGSSLRDVQLMLGHKYFRSSLHYERVEEIDPLRFHNTYHPRS